ncbi:hypothetical protein [Thorsellia anophelis]|uniref:Uncharacterized protein n=1 Tax=Thorsellia anophelis DSM 18579 TaxID=1123402 RepID=A0A1I0A0V6_9GAMM|nr:hypothetical protein [Thorsellia anophelis]SES87311.1 hypothetical protein SAMN02583745_00783 [Thorsellia anophelis DSM 18579]
MSQITWGLLAPEKVSSIRRNRSLELNGVIRYYNERAVPGTASVWYGKQLLLAVLGIAVAVKVREGRKKVQNIPVANAIEALAFKVTMLKNKGAVDKRVKGLTKLLLRPFTDFSYKNISKTGFYLVQPMRMSTAQALIPLGLASSSNSRFNSFTLTDLGNELIKKSGAKDLIEILANWVSGDPKLNFSGRVPSNLSCLNVNEPLPKDALKLLREVLVKSSLEGYKEDSIRRRNALCWMETLHQNEEPIDFNSTQPENLSSEHWADIKIGAHFNHVKFLALQVLNQIEGTIADKTSTGITVESLAKNDSIIDAIKLLSDLATNFLNYNNTHPDALKFCRECSLNKNVDGIKSVITNLVSRDMSTLIIQGNSIRPGEAFENRSIDISIKDDSPLGQFPPHISYRISNLYLLNMDLQNQLSNHLAEELLS